MTQNVFTGHNGLRNYLNPDNHPPLPLVELPPHLNPYHEQKVRIMVKLMSYLPLGNVKSLPAYSMLETAQKAGELDGVETLVEASSGNTVLSLAVLGRAFAIPNTVAVASHAVEPGKLNLLRLLGTSIQVVEEDICPDPTDPDSAPNIARTLGAQAGTFNPGQYENQANPHAHQRWTGPQLWEQTEGKITVLSAGLGTCGTLIGTAGYLRQMTSALDVIGVVRAPNSPVPGVRTEGLLREVLFSWQQHVDHLAQVGTVESYQLSADCCREGLLVGPSTGFAIAGLFQQLKQWSENGTLEQRRNQDGEVYAVVIAPDGPLAYLDEYFKYLPADYFPPIEGTDKLLAPVAQEHDLIADTTYTMDDLELTADQVLKRLDTTLVIDLRTRHEYDDHHIAGSCWLPFQDVRANLKMLINTDGLRSAQTILFVCSYGAQSAVIAHQARLLDCPNTYSLKGGTIEWSRRDLPRIVCCVEK